MKHIEGTFKGFQGLDLYYQSWQPESVVQAVVVLVHGLGGHSNLFNPAVQHLLQQNYEVYAFDLRGHGYSPGQRGHIHTWAEFREDLQAFLRFIHGLRCGCVCPCFLWGHSLGGTIALDYTLRSPELLQGLIVTAPALGKVRISPFKLALGRLLSGIYPRFSLKVGIQENADSRVLKILSHYGEDPLRHEYGSARLATEFLTTVDWIDQHSAALKIPLLLLHGTADQIVLPESSRTFFQQVMFPDKEHHEYPGGYHDLYVDIDYQVVLTDLKHWLERHLEGTHTCQPLTLMQCQQNYSTCK